MEMPTMANEYSVGVKNTLDTHGAPQQNAKFYRTDRKVLFSTRTFSAGDTVPTTIAFFTSDQQSVLSTNQFPLNGQALDILGLRITHCMKLSADAGLVGEAQQAFEEFSKLTVRYRNRSNIFQAPVSDLVPSVSYVDGSDVVVDSKLQSWLLFKNPIEYGSTQPIDFELSVPSSITLESTSGTSTPSLPGGVGSKYWIKLSLLCVEYTQI